MPSAKPTDNNPGQGSEPMPPALELTTGKPCKAQFTVTVPLPPEAAAIPEKESLYLSELKGLLYAAVTQYLNRTIPTEYDEHGAISKIYRTNCVSWGFYGPVERGRKAKRVVSLADRTLPYTECTVGVRCKIYAHGAEKVDMDINENGCLQLDWLPVPKYRDIRVTWTGRPADETVNSLPQLAESSG